MSVLVIAPHPDDETLGAGGTLLRARQSGEETHWLIVTEMRENLGFNASDIDRRHSEIAAVADAYGFASVTELGLATACLDQIPLGDIIEVMGKTIQQISPETVYVPYPGDAHSDHRIVFNAAQACTKSFRYPSIKRVIAMEIVSETEFGIDPSIQGFRPNLFVDISNVLDDKIRIMNMFEGETAAAPFPRSERTIRSLAHWRGSQSGRNAAEAFQILKEIR